MIYFINYNLYLFIMSLKYSDLYEELETIGSGSYGTFIFHFI